MKIFIFSDMEGISGIFRSSQVKSSEADYAQGCKYMTLDINACIQGCFEGGATKVVVRDGHSRGGNVILEELDERAELITGAQGEKRFESLKDFDGLILLGYHAMAGTYGAILEHTFCSCTWQNCWMNGNKVGEFAIDAAIAGDMDVPVIMTSGDDKLCSEAKSFIKDIEAVQVKKGINTEGGQLLPLKMAHELIRNGAMKAVKNCKKVKPFKCSQPVTFRLELVERTKIPFNRPGIKIIDGRTYEVASHNVEDALGLLM